MSQKTKNNSTSKAFSLIELIVVISIFSVIILIGSTSLLSGFITGQTQSTSVNELNKNMNNIFTFVEGRMNSATKVTAVTPSYYGFKVLNTNELVVFGSSTGCTYLAYNGTDTLYTLSSNPCASKTKDEVLGGQRLSSSNIVITKFLTKSSTSPIIDSRNFNPAYPTIPPYLYLSITATDKKNSSITSTTENTYSLSYGTVKTFN